MRVPFNPIAREWDALAEEMSVAIDRVTSSGQYLLGVEAQRFEGGFANIMGSRYAVGVNSGLDALTIALVSAGIGAGDEVLVPAHTFIATYLSVLRSGAVPVPVDSGSGSFNLDVTRLEQHLTSATRALVPVHLFGIPVDLDLCESFAKSHDLRLIYDAAQAHGSCWKGRPVGASGDASAWSFYPGKTLGALGDGGAITTSDEGLFLSSLSLRNYGCREERYIHQDLGFNSRLDEIQAAILRVKLEHLSKWVDRRKSIANFYLEELCDLPLDLPRWPDSASPSWHIFAVAVHDRESVVAQLSQLGVEVLIHYPRLPIEQAALSFLGLDVRRYPQALLDSRRVLSLPVSHHLSDAEVEFVVESVRRVTTAG